MCIRDSLRPDNRVKFAVRPQAAVQPDRADLDNLIEIAPVSYTHLNKI